jgi:hypothetical protein
MILYLVLWLVPAVSLVLPHRKFVTPGDPAWVGWLLASGLALLWPWCAAMFVRKWFIEQCLGVTTHRAERWDV